MISFPFKPMLLEVAKAPFNSIDHIFELKVDGIRGIMFYQNNSVRLHSKTGKDCTLQFPELLSPLIKSEEAVLDGEIAVIKDGKPDFEAVMQRYMSGPRRIETLLHSAPAFYIVWDILWYNGKSLVDRPLIERKEILNDVLANSEFVRKMDFVDTEGLLMWQAIQKHGLEGIVAKKKQARYYPGRRTSAFLKIKNYQVTDINILGYKKLDGSILVGTNGQVQGHALGMGKQEKKVLWDLIKEYGKVKGDSIWLPPGIRGRVKFTTWSAGGKMRDCSWQGFII